MVPGGTVGRRVGPEAHGTSGAWGVLGLAVGKGSDDIGGLRRVIRSVNPVRWWVMVRGGGGAWWGGGV